MWLPDKAFQLFQISRESFDSLQKEVSSLKAERDALKSELTTTKANFDWLRIRCNTLEVERAQLIGKAYGVQVPAPEIVRQPAMLPELGSNIFEDVGEKAAKDLGFPSYDK